MNFLVYWYLRFKAMKARFEKLLIDIELRFCSLMIFINETWMTFLRLC